MSNGLLIPGCAPHFKGENNRYKYFPSCRSKSKKPKESKEPKSNITSADRVASNR